MARKNPVPIGGAVIANPIETAPMSAQPQVEIRLEKGLRATKDPRNPYVVKIAQVKYPPERRKSATPIRAVPARAPSAKAARAARPAKKAARKAPARRKPSRAPARPGFPPFTPPSAQKHAVARHNPLPGFGDFGDSKRELAGDVLKMTGLLLGVGIGVPALRQLILKLIKKENVGPEGSVTTLSHAIQTVLALGIAGLAEAKIEDKGLRRATQALALAAALSRPVNHAITKYRPGSEIGLLGEASQPVRPLRLDFDVLPPGTNLIEGLGQEVSDLDTDPVLDEILRQRAAKQLPAPAEAPAILSNPQVTAPGEPLVGEVLPPDTSEPLLASPQPPTWDDQVSGYLPLGDLVGALN
ncbi:MAG: hypothetical protein KDH09_11020 [Chrysiogenetes bacterium]|nr:hypothetical protein [Chrysiogenetes bacterium]